MEMSSLPMDCILVRYGEIGTKARPTRRHWEEMLVNNIRASLGECRVKRIEGRIVVEGIGDYDKLGIVFGVTSFSPAFRVEAEIDKIKKRALETFLEEKHRMKKDIPTFRVTARRLSKNFPTKSQEVNTAVGEHIRKSEPSRVSLKNFDVEVGIELEKEAYIFTEKISGPGGIPVGVQGPVFTDLQKEEDAVAAFFMLKRGCTLVYDGREDLKSMLEKFSSNHKIRKGGREETMGVVTRDRFATLDLESMKERTQPIYTPLIGLTEEEIERVKRLVFR
jgi:thiamine biosynthesis protein ThiI